MTIKLQLIDQAYNVNDFDNQANELVNALGKHMITDEEAVHYGFKLALEQVTQCPELIRPTLYGTMKAVKKKCRHLINTGEYKQMNAVSLATNHVYEIIRNQSIKRLSKNI
ncbi:hypothetical protein LRO89_02975 [Priestia megaterium]|uniref:hypothetical protein n=1 Tax=Priestia megaterium TaxID=1404 RepID=UPI0039C41CFE